MGVSKVPCYANLTVHPFIACLYPANDTRLHVSEIASQAIRFRQKQPCDVTKGNDAFPRMVKTDTSRHMFALSSVGHPF